MMKTKDITISLIKEEKLSMNDIYEFVSKYLEEKKKAYTSEQLQYLVSLIVSGFLSLEEPVRYFTQLYKLNVMKVMNKNGEVLKTFIS
jgi:predicted HTH domain antitoxin